MDARRWCGEYAVSFGDAGRGIETLCAGQVYEAGRVRGKVLLAEDVERSYVFQEEGVFTGMKLAFSRVCVCEREVIFLRWRGMRRW